MKITHATATLLLSGLISLMACDRENHDRLPCSTLGGVTITNQKGRIYQWTTSEPSFYYIGNEQEVTNGVNGGYILCNDLAPNFRKEGLLVIYSGVDKGSQSDTGDPLFAYLYLKSIEEVK